MLGASRLIISSPTISSSSVTEIPIPTTKNRISAQLANASTRMPLRFILVPPLLHLSLSTQHAHYCRVPSPPTTAASPSSRKPCETYLIINSIPYIVLLCQSSYPPSKQDSQTSLYSYLQQHKSEEKRDFSISSLIVAHTSLRAVSNERYLSKGEVAIQIPRRASPPYFPRR